MAFGSNKLTGFSKSFDNGLSTGFKSHADKASVDLDKLANPYQFANPNTAEVSTVRFYDRNALWTRWRRGYELYTIVQSVMGSFGGSRADYGDYRLYFAYQLFPGLFIPARLFLFPTLNQELKEQIVGVRDADGFNFYNYGLPILAVRYLKDGQNGTYTQSGTTVTVTLNNHGLQIADSVYLRFTSGAGVISTLTITSKTENTFNCTAATGATTSGNVTVFLSTTFGDNRWTQTRVQLRSIFDPIPSLVGERMVDRALERDPGVTATYSRAGSTVTVTCSQVHGLSTDNNIFASVSTGTVQSKQYIVTVLSTTQLQFTTYDSGTTSGNLTVKRLIGGYDYSDYVGYTLTAIDSATNELVFQRKDSYGYGKTQGQSTAQVQSPAHRGFTVGRFLTTEMRYQCTCQDYMHKNNYNLFKTNISDRWPTTPISSVKPGNSLNKDNSITPNRDNPGTHTDFGYSSTVSGFYDIPDFTDARDTSYPELEYYQLRWCKHIYAAMFSINHDEGNEPILNSGTYVQSGANITLQISNHGLATNTKIQINFTSGSAISGEYSISQVVNKDSFKIVYPFSGTTNGYCEITNLKRHSFIDAWLKEPNDKPIGEAYDAFYAGFEKENQRTRQEAERLSKMSHGMEWSGATTTTGIGFLPQEIADYSVKESTNLLADDVRRSDGKFDVAGILLNSTERMADMMSKFFNILPSQVQSENFGMLNAPLYNYTYNYQYGFTNGGQYLNGVPFNVFSSSTTTAGVETENPDTVTVLDCSTYDPATSQDFVVDAGTYST